MKLSLIFRIISFLLCGLLLTGCGLATFTPAPKPTATAVPAATPTAPPPAPASATSAASTVPATVAAVFASPSAQAVPLASPTVPAVTPPGQPASGPGGTIYAHKTVTENVFGTGETSYYLFEPADPIPASAPVIVLMHGYIDLTPVKSQPWIDHLVKRGNIVIYPVYQAYANSTGENFVSNALKATGAALEQLRSMNKIRAETDNLSVMGYSAGGVIAANYATLAQENGLPVPKVLYLIAPGGAVGFGLSFGQYKLEIPNFRLPEAADLGKIAPATKMVIFTGDRDIVVGDVAAKYIWQNTGQIPADNKAFLRLNSDNHGSPALVADHGVGNRSVPDALNFYGTWKIFDALQNCALNNKECDIALSDTPAQRYMGKWSDGQPVKELTPIKNP